MSVGVSRNLGLRKIILLQTTTTNGKIKNIKRLKIDIYRKIDINIWNIRKMDENRSMETDACTIINKESTSKHHHDTSEHGHSLTLKCTYTETR
jgi:hypothetical protein